MVLNPKDLVVALAVAIPPPAPSDAWTTQDLAAMVGISLSQVHMAVVRLKAAGLLGEKGLKSPLNRSGLLDFVLFGARYSFPPVFGRVARGIPTGLNSHAFKSGMIRASNIALSESSWVWPSPLGELRGVSLTPLFPGVGHVYIAFPELYSALVHFDALRAGKAREREAAEAFFRKELAWKS
jgi:hypothetical protein